jgi:hypothetical protein
MNIIPEKKFGKIGCINNMDILIKFTVNNFSNKKCNKIINIIFDNSLSTIGQCFLNLKNGIKKLITFIPSDYIIIIYTNYNNIYYGKKDLSKIYKALDKVDCVGFNNYKKYLDINLNNCILFTDEEVKYDNTYVITDENCLDLNFLISVIEHFKNNIGNFTLKFFPLNNNFIKNIYENDNFDSIIINNLIKNKEYKFLINMDILCLDKITSDILETKLFNEKDIVLESNFKMYFVKDNKLINDEVIIHKILNQTIILENKIDVLYKEKNLEKIKHILLKLKKIYSSVSSEIITKKYQNLLNKILYLEEEIKSENLKSLELNHEMKFNHFDLNIR